MEFGFSMSKSRFSKQLRRDSAEMWGITSAEDGRRGRKGTKIRGQQVPERGIANEKQTISQKPITGSETSVGEGGGKRGKRSCGRGTTRREGRRKDIPRERSADDTQQNCARQSTVFASRNEASIK